jgi:hypothetical protein
LKANDLLNFENMDTVAETVEAEVVEEAPAPAAEEAPVKKTRKKKAE